MLSVTSSSSRSAGKPLCDKALTTVPTKSGSSNCSGETLTFTFTCAGQWLAASRQASLSTQVPIGTISRVSSAKGMNLTGLTNPCTLLFQRNKASKLTTSSLVASTTGW